MLTTVHIIGIILTVSLLLAVSILSGRKVKDAKAFTTGGRSGSWMVCGAILGTLVGGQSTIGTAQLAFSFGLSAWWFTIGAALGALVLGVLYAAPLRRSGCSTLMEIVKKQYGRRAETVGSILFLVGIFISITSQLLSSSAMISSLFGASTTLALAIGAALIAALVLSGGIKSAGAGGIVKLVLLYISSIAAGVAVWKIGGGLSGIRESIAAIYESPRLAAMNDIGGAEEIHRRYGTFMARGPLKDLGGCLSLTLGVVCTQTYAQGIWSAATTRKAKRGAAYCAALIPLIGAACTLVGMYMRGHYVTATELATMQAAGEQLPDGIGVMENSLQAFPTFILAHLPAWLGGIALGTLLINILGCGSGLVLGAATILTRDVYGNILTALRRTPRVSLLTQTRLSIVLLLMLAMVMGHFMQRSFINDLGFLSLGLRAAALLLPLSCALWLSGRFKPQAVTASMISGTVVMLAAGMLALPGDAMYYGLFASTIVMLSGLKKNDTPN